ncbi:hypothetical protein DFH29DRAFT_997830 [Suillus ampliporus]|nr:hypothetical protein DFH29DRAFT_997830 [Suillus ampliporus]
MARMPPMPGALGETPAHITSEKEGSVGTSLGSEESEEQANLVKRAEGQLTEAERQKIKARERVFSRSVSRASSSDSRGKGPSELKGKAPDPRDWGGANIPRTETDLEAQRDALAAHNLARENETSIEAQEEALRTYSEAQTWAENSEPDEQYGSNNTEILRDDMVT